MARMFQDAEKFLESLADDKLKNFSGHRGTIVQGDKFRIEYKGVSAIPLPCPFLIRSAQR